jgi:hypothetical protein
MTMPDKETVQRARRDLKQGKSPGTAAGEFVRDEIHHIREGKHGAKNAKQAIAIALSEARRAGVPIPDKGSGARATRSSAKKRSPSRKATAKTGSSTTRARAALKALKKQPTRSASHLALARHARAVARKAARTQ